MPPVAVPEEKETRTYNERAAAADREYEKAYPLAVAAMPEGKRAKMVSAGLDQPATEKYMPVRRSDEDEDDGREGRGQIITRDVADEVDTLEDRLQENFKVNREQAVAIAAWHRNEVATASEKLQAFLFQRVVAGFLLPGNVKLRAIGLAITVKLGALNGLRSQAEAATKARVTPAAISAVVNYWCDKFGMPRNGFMKGEDARKSYSDARKKNHWRNQKCQKPK